jgi:maltoporin
MKSVLLAIALCVSCTHAMASPTLSFGSYGRVGLAASSGGGRAHSPAIVQFGPRLAAGNYLELDFGTQPIATPYGQSSMLTTLAFDEGLFHYDGQWNSNMALRRFQLTVTALGGTPFYAIVGSQWNRGDDVYLLNFWPLDNVNSSGISLGYDGSAWKSLLHIGLSRLIGNQQQQSIEVSAPQFGAQSVITLDRQRFLSTGSVTHYLPGKRLQQKVKLYAEYHHLPSGKETLGNNPEQTIRLTDDRGTLVGVQYGIWGFGDQSHVNLFARVATGLAAYDELAAAQSVNRDRRTVDAYEARLALSANLQSEDISIMLGGYGRVFNDGDVNTEDFDDRQELSVVLRPMLRLGAFTPALEGSMQISRTNGLNPRTGEQALGQVFQIAALPGFTFAQTPGAYSRPRINGVIAVSLLNSTALSYYAEADPRSAAGTVWFFGANAEWWFGRGGSY